MIKLRQATLAYQILINVVEVVGISLNKRDKYNLFFLKITYFGWNRVQLNAFR